MLTRMKPMLLARPLCLALALWLVLSLLSIRLAAGGGSVSTYILKPNSTVPPVLNEFHSQISGEHFLTRYPGTTYYGAGWSSANVSTTVAGIMLKNLTIVMDLNLSKAMSTLQQLQEQGMAMPAPNLPHLVYIAATGSPSAVALLAGSGVNMMKVPLQEPPYPFRGSSQFEQLLQTKGLVSAFILRLRVLNTTHVNYDFTKNTQPDSSAFDSISPVPPASDWDYYQKNVGTVSGGESNATLSWQISTLNTASCPQIRFSPNLQSFVVGAGWTSYVPFNVNSSGNSSLLYSQALPQPPGQSNIGQPSESIGKSPNSARSLSPAPLALLLLLLAAACALSCGLV